MESVENCIRATTYQGTLMDTQEPVVAYALLLNEPQTSQTYEILKRFLDICGAIVGIILLAFLIPFIALGIYLEDHGPIFYKQVRVGRYGRPFITYKFRSMMVNADKYIQQHSGLLASWREYGKLEKDPRITRFGAFLRRTSLDELPQMFNVLWGEMSLVGPRAIQFSEVPRFGELIKLRQIVKPGITGLWQVAGRSMTDYEQRSVLDCTYVMNRSFFMDIHIILKTIPVVILGIGAY